MVPWCIW